MDAVPKGGAVRYIRQPDADPRALDALLGGVAHQARPEELEDAFMMMLRQHQDAGASAPRMAHGRADDMAQASASARNGGDGPVIVVRDLVRRFGDFTAVASTSFEVARGGSLACWGRTAPARPPPSACCAGCCPPPAAIWKWRA